VLAHAHYFQSALEECRIHGLRSYSYSELLITPKLGTLFRIASGNSLRRFPLTIRGNEINVVLERFGSAKIGLYLRK
jgi:hypothetical protein